MLVPTVLAHGGVASWFPTSLPPVHPILVNFTAALVPASLACDLFGRWLNRDSLRSAAWWNLLGAAAVTPLTAVAGWAWMRSMDPADHGPLQVHKWLGITIAVLLVPLTAWRGWSHLRGRRPGWPYLIPLTLLVGTVVVQGHLGGSMTFAAAADDVTATTTPAPHATGHGHAATGASTPTTTPTGHSHDDGGGSAGLNWSDHIDLKPSTQSSKP